MPKLGPVEYAIPFFILLIVLEMVWARRNAPQKYEPRDTLTSLALGVGSTAAGALTAGFVAAAAVWLFEHRIATIGWAWWAWIACFVLDDFNYYWAHRTGHRVRWFEAVMNTPSHHRVHHAINPVYLDRNYAGVFIIWDRLLGTFQPERDDQRIQYGIVKQLGSFNLLWAVFHEWIGIAQDVWRAPWRHKLSYLVRAPGWTHDGSRDTSDTIRARWEAREAVQPAE